MAKRESAKRITKEHYEDRELVDRYVKVWTGFRGYLGDLKAFVRLLPSGGSVLDAGCGPGTEVDYFSKRSLRAVGIDYSRAMIDKARELVPNGEFRVMNIKRLKFPKNSFDGLWTAGVLVHFAERELPGIFDEFKRVLKPKGILYICTRVGRGGGAEHGVEGGRFYINYFGKDALLGLLKMRGMQILSTQITKDETRKGINWITVFARIRK